MKAQDGGVLPLTTSAMLAPAPDSLPCSMGRSPPGDDSLSSGMAGSPYRRILQTWQSAMVQWALGTGTHSLTDL